MMKASKTFAAIGVAAAVGLAPTASQGAILWPGDLSTTTTVLGGIGAAVYFLVIKKDDAPEGEEAVKAAMLYLKSNHLQLAQDLGEGQGPVLQELAAQTRIAPEHREVLGAQLQAHAGELLELLDPSELDEARTLKFLERYVEIVQQNPVLAHDLRSLDA